MKRQVPTPEEIAKLPKKYRDYIASLEYFNGRAKVEIERFQGAQSPKPFYTTDFESISPDGFQTFRRYFDAHEIIAEWAGIRLSVRLHHEMSHIAIAWENIGRSVAIPATFVPVSYQQAHILPSVKPPDRSGGEG